MKPQTFNADLSALPAAIGPLTGHPRWVVWKWEESSADKWTKVPHLAGNPRANASISDPSTWSDYSTAVAAAKAGRADGVGYVLTPADGLPNGTGALDLDDCRDPDTGVIAPWAQEVIDGTDSYVEVTVSGTGLRVIGTVDGADLHTSVEIPGGGKIEFYRHATRFITVSGSQLRDCAELQNIDELIDCTHAWLGGEPSPEPKPAGATTSDDLNMLALANLDAWVPELFPGAPKSKNGGYRISSKMLGRDLEEDLSISPKGIKDFGIADMGDKRKGRRTPIDVVMEYGKKDFGAARTWLGERLGIDLNSSIGLRDFVAYLPAHEFIFLPTGAMWPVAGVNARLGKGAAGWLDIHARVEQMTWYPGLPTLIKDKLFSADGTWTERPGCVVYNQYRPPTVVPGDATKAGLWVDLVREVFPDDEEHIMCFLAHCRQHPGDKINHMLVLGGPPGIGKDTIVTSARMALGPWNLKEVSPSDVTGDWNGFLKSTLLLINELRDLGDSNRVAFYEGTKWMLASPPATLYINEKNVKQYYIPNVCGVIGTTNHKVDGLYLTADDRRHYVAWSPLGSSPKTKEDWIYYYRWLGEDGGAAHVAAYLDAVDLTDFNPKAPPKKTDAFWEIVDASQQPEERELADVLEELGKGAVTLDMVVKKARDMSYAPLAEFLEDRTKRRIIAVRMDKAGYVSVKNPYATDNQWKVGKRRCSVYCPKEARKNEVEELVNDLVQKHTK